MTTGEQIKTAFDTALGTGGITSPIWLQWIENGSKSVALIGGATLVVIRLMIAWRDWRNGKKD